MEAFVNGCLAKVVFEDDQESRDRIRDLITCCYCNSLQLDSRIEYALCLRSLQTHLNERRLDRETFILFSELAPPLSSKPPNHELHLELLTQVFLKEDGISLDEAFGISMEEEIAEHWRDSIQARKQHLQTILNQIEDRNLALLEIKAQFPKTPILSQLSQFLDQKIKQSKQELSKIQKGAIEIMKEKHFSSEVLNLVDPSHEEEVTHLSELQEDLKTIKAMLKDLQEQSEAQSRRQLELFARLDDITEQLKSLTPPPPPSQSSPQELPNPSGDRSPNRCSSTTEEQLKEVLKECEEIQREFDLDRGHVTMMPQVMTVRKRSAQESLTEAKKKSKKPTLLFW